MEVAEKEESVNVAAEIEIAAKEEMAKIAGVEVEKPEDPKPEPEVQKEEEVKPEVEEQPSLEDQVRQLFDENKKLRKALETTNGRYGDELHKLRQQVSSFNHNAAPIRGTFDENHPAFDNLKSDFPELAETLLNGFKQAMSVQEAQKASVIEEIQQPVQSAQTQDPAVMALAMNRLQSDHPDFADLAGFDSKRLAQGVVSIEWKDKEFGKWIDSMPEEVREAILVGGSNDEPTADQVMQIANILTEYKKVAQEPVKQNSIKDHRPKPDLKKALLPDGRAQGRSVALSDDEIIQAAARDEMRKILNGEG